jgi:hypothetical protein
MGALVQTLPHHHRLRPAKEGSAPSSPCPWLPDRPAFRRILSLRFRSGPQSCSPLDQAHPLRGGRDFYTRACPTAGHPTAKSGITTQLSGPVLRVGIEPRRAHWVEIDQATFPRAPLRSCTIGFPEYSSDLGFSPRGLPDPGEAQALARLHPSPSRFTSRLVLQGWLLRHTSLTIRRPPSAQSSFACRKRYSRQGGVTHHLEGHYPFVLAPTSSCARPPSSAGTSCSSLMSSGLCRLRPAPAGRGSFPTLLCKSFPGCLGPDPGRS